MAKHERFTEEARMVVADTQTEAHEFGHGMIGTEHLLLGILRGNSLATEALGRFNITSETMRPRIRVMVGGASSKKLTGEIPYSGRVEQILEQAVREALALGDDKVKAEHILLALVTASRGIAREVMEHDFGADDTSIRLIIMELRDAAKSAGDTA